MTLKGVVTDIAGMTFFASCHRVMIEHWYIPMTGRAEILPLKIMGVNRNLCIDAVVITKHHDCSNKKGFEVDHGHHQ